jgi:hypothetical protein
MTTNGNKLNESMPWYESQQVNQSFATNHNGGCRLPERLFSLIKVLFIAQSACSVLFRKDSEAVQSSAHSMHPTQGRYAF